MAHTAITDPEMKVEIHEEGYEAKVDTLAEWVREARHVVVFTGAGISTSCGIPDFRGPEGVWTLKAEGRQRTKPTTSTIKAIPSTTHMSLVKLQREGIVKYIISQNCDGLHRRSGIPPTGISELHGNGNIEYCIECGKQYLRDFSCYRITHSSDHYTGRHCVVPGCNGKLWDSTIDFGQNLPEEPLEKAYEHSKKSDLHIVLGSSLTVSPACNMPRTTKKRGGRLVIVNLQKTPLTDMADMHIHQTTDAVMDGLMERLGLEIPEWRLRRRFVVGHTFDAETESWNVHVRGIDVDDPDLPATIFQNVTIEPPSRDVRVERTSERNFKFCVTTRDPYARVPLTVNIVYGFMGHYREPDLRIPYNLTLDTCERTVLLAYNPFERSWQLTPGPLSVSAVSHGPVRTVTRAVPAEVAGRMWAASAKTVDANGNELMVVVGGAGTSREPGGRRGYLDILKVASGQWSRRAERIMDGLDGVQQRVLARWCQTASVFPDRPNEVYLIGGWDWECQYNDVWVLDIEAGTLTEVDVTGATPSVRAGHTAAVVDDRILVFGGAYCKGGPYKFNNELWAFDRDAASWTQLDTRGAAPSKRAQHSATLVGDQMFVIGGTDGDSSLADVHVLDVGRMRWRAVEAGGANAPVGRDASSGEFRVAGVRNTATLVRRRCPGGEQSLLLVVGLQDADRAYRTHALDTDSLTWQRVQGSGPALVCHVACATDTGFVALGSAKEPDAAPALHCVDIGSGSPAA